MAKTWPSNVTCTYEVGSQTGPAYDDKYSGYADVVNAFLALGWRILNTYVERTSAESASDECVCLLGWAEGGEPPYPECYRPRG